MADSNLIQAHIPRRRSRYSFVFRMKCELTSKTNHDVMISRVIKVPAFKDICREEKKRVKLGHLNMRDFLKVENNALMPYPKQDFIFGQQSKMSHDWEVLSFFFSIHNVEPTWLDCDNDAGAYDEDLGGWTGCMGKV